ncbi:hypothetical protein [Cupriavidus lacunae]|uniref:hypothetical protein n=1 Tax=Cupriavidus lacunae TaxID=2666307 RepID=UPI001FCA040A|nr:hypothetical protein [Cupriavidus lacunae]
MPTHGGTQLRAARHASIRPGLHLLVAACAAVALSACDRDGDRSAPVPAAPMPSASAAPAPPAPRPRFDDILDASGKLVPEAYVAIASDYSSEEAIAYRYGPANAKPVAAPTYWQPGDKTFYPHGNVCYQKEFPKDELNTNLRIIYQLGALDCSRNDFGSNMGDVIYRADAPSDPGVTSLLTLDLSAGTVAEKPQLPWVYGHVSTDPQLKNHIAANGGVLPRRPIAMGRCSEHDCAQALIAFQNGLIASVGSNTASHSASVKLPAGKVPTAIAITTNSEFALVTVWDTKALKGQVAVLALGSLADGSKVGGPYDPSAGSWPGLYPGLRNMSNFIFIKLLGFIDLPEMAAPTGISAVTDFGVMQDNSTQGWLIDPVGNRGASLTMTEVNPGTNSINQKSFTRAGINGKLVSRAGVAAVISKSEKKVIFLNLKPLFDKVNNAYFEGSNASLRSTLANTGLGDTQWPPAFAVENYAPTVIKSMNLPEKPTVVKVSILPNPGRAWVATEDGKIRAFSVAGVQSGRNMDPNLIKEMKSLQVGKNPTSMTHHVIVGLGNSNTRLWVVSRGAQQIQLVDMVSLTIEKTLQDSRIVDPITVDETQQNPLLTSVITITDYTGKQVMNYRYAPIALQGGNTPLHIGIGKSGNELFEFGGTYAVPGKPFDFTQSNVP